MNMTRNSVTFHMSHVFVMRFQCNPYGWRSGSLPIVNTRIAGNSLTDSSYTNFPAGKYWKEEVPGAGWYWPGQTDHLGLHKPESVLGQHIELVAVAVVAQTAVLLGPHIEAERGLEHRSPGLERRQRLGRLQLVPVLHNPVPRSLPSSVQ